MSRRTGGPGTVDETAAVYRQAGSENFPVASRLLPRAVRADLLALYGFARLADDLGDEAEGDRLAQLDELEAEVRRAAEGRATRPLIVPLVPLLLSGRVSVEPLVDLIEANRRDQVIDRYETFDDLLGYCRLSAAPVGRMVLGVFGVATPDRIALADDVCHGLQIVEHLQDVGEDARRARVYLPQVDLRRAGVAPDDLVAPVASAALRRVVALEASRARRLLSAGPVLAVTLPWRTRMAVAGFTAGGLAALDAVVAANYDVLGSTCRPNRRLFAGRLASVVGGPREAAARTRRPVPAESPAA